MTENENTSVETVLENGEVSPRSPVYAVLLTFLMTGLGHIYCGELVVGLGWAAVGAVSGVASLWMLSSESGSLFVSSLPMWFVSLAAATHAWSLARHCSSDYRLKSYNRWYAYLLLLVLGSFGGIGHGMIVKDRFVEAFVTPSIDMQPTLLRGDRFLVDKTAYVDAPIEVNDVVVFKNPADRNRTYVKRVFALEGDTVEIRDGQLLVNGERVGDQDPEVDDFAPQTVPQYSCFVLGDDRKKSRDSRHFGVVPYVAVIGKAVTVFWPQESWTRFGQID